MANTYTQIHYKQSHSVPDGTAGRGVISISTKHFVPMGQAGKRTIESYHAKHSQLL